MNKGIEMSTSHDPAALLTDAIKRLTLPGDIETVFVPMPTKLAPMGWSNSTTIHPVRNCTICNEAFRPKRGNQIKCGSAECVREANRRACKASNAARRYSRENML